MSDAGGGVPFFRSFNGIGLPGTSALAKVVAASLDGASEPARKKFTLLGSLGLKQKPVDLESYTRTHRSLVRREVSNAQRKNAALNAYKIWLKTSHTTKVNIKDKMHNFHLGKELADRILGRTLQQDAQPVPLEVVS